MAERVFANTSQPLSETLGMAPVDPEASGSSRVNVGQTERIFSAAGGALLLTVGLRQGSLGGFLLALAGGGLVFRGMSGYCPMNEALGRNSAETGEEAGVVEISKSLTIMKPREEVWAYWRRHENLPNFMYHLKEVRQITDKRSHWVAQIADSKLARALGSVEWDADIIDEVPNERLVWKSIPGSLVDHSGEVRFNDVPGGRPGTELHATIKYRPPAGQLGTAVAKLFNQNFKQMIKQDLRRFKQLLETGEIATIAGQPSGRKRDQLLENKPHQYSEPNQKHESLML
ncbi:SRPBCC family protein [Tellurirhabdus rosea]|uniref:SRPBCC family protein n=1 Tax=Tellurirhabdus rosea TaxID=2674997 RepID=UPI0022573DDE|nr:SRPBCC family protein [Tellurirhabdus rosea]